MYSDTFHHCVKEQRHNTCFVSNMIYNIISVSRLLLSSVWIFGGGSDLFPVDRHISLYVSVSANSSAVFPASP